MKKILTQNLRPKITVSLSFKWYFVNNIFLENNEFNKDSIHNKVNNIYININNKPGVTNNQFFIKNLTTNIMSKESKEFFENLKKIIEAQFKNIDTTIINKQGNINKSSFISLLIILRTNSKLQSILPFIMNYLFSIYDKKEINGYKKKIIIIMVLNSLINNHKISIEYFLHIIIKILVKYILGGKLSVNNCIEEISLRKNSAELLYILILENIDKYAALKDNIFKLFSKYLGNLDTINDKNSIEALFYFFSLMPGYDIELFFTQNNSVISNYDYEIIKSEGFINCLIKIFKNNVKLFFEKYYNLYNDILEPYISSVHLKNTLNNKYLNFIKDTHNNQNNNYFLLSI